MYLIYIILEMIHTQTLGTILHFYDHMPYISMSTLIYLFYGNSSFVADLIRVRFLENIIIMNIVPIVAMNIVMGALVVEMDTGLDPTFFSLVIGAHKTMVTYLLMVITKAYIRRMRKRWGIVHLLQFGI